MPCGSYEGLRRHRRRGGDFMSRLRIVLLSMAVAALLLVATASSALAGISLNAID